MVGLLDSFIGFAVCAPMDLLDGLGCEFVITYKYSSFDAVGSVGGSFKLGVYQKKLFDQPHHMGVFFFFGVQDKSVLAVQWFEVAFYTGILIGFLAFVRRYGQEMSFVFAGCYKEGNEYLLIEGILKGVVLGAVIDLCSTGNIIVDGIEPVDIFGIGCFIQVACDDVKYSVLLSDEKIGLVRICFILIVGWCGVAIRDQELEVLERGNSAPVHFFESISFG